MAKSNGKRKEHNVLYLIVGVLVVAFVILSAITSVKSSYEKATVQEVKRTYDKKRNGSKRKYYADVVVSLEYNGQQMTGETTVQNSSQSKLPKVGDVIDVQITEDDRVLASSKGNNILMTVVGLLAGGLMIFAGVRGIIDKKKAQEQEPVDS